MLVPWRVNNIETFSPYILGTHPTRVVHPKKKRPVNPLGGYTLHEDPPGPQSSEDNI